MPIETEPHSEVQRRLDAEQNSRVNQLAVVAYLKHRRIEEYVVRAYPDLYFQICDTVLNDARREVLRDVHIDTLTACLDFLLYDHNWESN